MWNSLLSFIVFSILGVTQGLSGEITAKWKRNVRALWNFEYVVECATGRSALLYYNDYGCWCGFGGAGKPVDGIDACCKAHDHCYDEAVAKNDCSVVGEYADGYNWSCDKAAGQKTGTPVCGENKSACSKDLCACDTEGAKCFAKFKYTGKKGCPKKQC